MFDFTSIFQLSRSPWFHLLGAPILWVVHFMISYIWIEFACRLKLLVLDSTLLGLTILSWCILIFTLIFTVAAMYVGWSAYKNWQSLKKMPKKTESTLWEVEARRFISISGVTLSALFSLVILLSGFPVLMLNPCAQ